MRYFSDNVQIILAASTIVDFAKLATHADGTMESKLPQSRP